MTFILFFAGTSLSLALDDSITCFGGGEVMALCPRKGDPDKMLLPDADMVVDDDDALMSLGNGTQVADALMNLGVDLLVTSVLMTLGAGLLVTDAL